MPETLAPTFESEKAALAWGAHLDKWTVLKVIPARDKPGRFRLRVERKTDEAPE